MTAPRLGPRALAALLAVLAVTPLARADEDAGGGITEPLRWLRVENTRTASPGGGWDVVLGCVAGAAGGYFLHQADRYNESVAFDLNESERAVSAVKTHHANAEASANNARWDAYWAGRWYELYLIYGSYSDYTTSQTYARSSDTENANVATENRAAEASAAYGFSMGRKASDDARNAGYARGAGVAYLIAGAVMAFKGLSALLNPDSTGPMAQAARSPLYLVSAIYPEPRVAVAYDF